MIVESEKPTSKEEAPGLFELGDIVVTPGALQSFVLAEELPLPYVLRHITGDWGDLPQEDVEANKRAVKGSAQVFSSYKLSTGIKIYVITEGDRSVTTLLLPTDY